MDPKFQLWMQQQKINIESILKQFLPKFDMHPENLNQAMHYAVLGHGKRIRPLLVIAASQIGNADQDAVTQRIAAVEFLHTYSLIHDDLPCMDNDELRHGKPACHKQFGEAMALLAGDTLQSLAFESLSKINQLPLQQNLLAFQLLARASGFNGMAGGQALDLLNTGKLITLDAMITMHHKKTGALMTASVLLGYSACYNYTSDIAFCLKHYAEKIGLAFQVIDDILDYEASTEVLGKTAGKDKNDHKATFISLLGIKLAKQYAKQLIDEAISIIEKYRPNSQYLIELANYIIQRSF